MTKGLYDTFWHKEQQNSIFRERPIITCYINITKESARAQLELMPLRYLPFLHKIYDEFAQSILKPNKQKMEINWSNNNWGTKEEGGHFLGYKDTYLEYFLAKMYFRPSESSGTLS